MKQTRRRASFLVVKMPKFKGTIAILGGMGPEASARLLSLVVEKAAKEFGAKNGDDFPEIIVDSIPISDFISNKTNLNSALRILKTRVEKLENLNPSCFSLACNTAHLLFGDLQMVTSVPFISIIEEVAREIKHEGLKTVGLLATPVTIKSGLFKETLSKRKIRLIVPTSKQQEILEEIIRGVIAQKISQLDKLNLLSIADSLKARGAKGIILGCTELPLVFPKKDFSLPVFDSLEVLATALLKKSLG